MRLTRCLAILLATFLLVAVLSASLAEDVIVDPDEVETLDAQIDEEVEEIDGAAELPEDGETVDESEADPEATGALESAPVYARVVMASAPLYDDRDAEQSVAELGKGETVLLIGSDSGLAAVAVAHGSYTGCCMGQQRNAREQSQNSQYFKKQLSHSQLSSINC